MIHQGALFVLDAKYYKYGVTYSASDLPESADINKQITYGDYAEMIREKAEIQSLFGKLSCVYNAFVMPFDQNGIKLNAEEPYLYIGSATPNWRKSKMTHECVQGILVDVKHLITAYHRKEDELSRLADIIISSI